MANLKIEATGYQRKSVKRKIILLLVLLVVGMFILLMLKPKRKGNGSIRPVLGDPTPNKSKPVRPNDVNRKGEQSDGTPFSIG